MAQSHQNRIHASVCAFQTASDALILALERMNDEAAARAPREGGWNAAQIGYHVAITNDYLAGILTGAVPRAIPTPDGFAENPEILKSVPSKVETFPQLEPPPTATRAEAIAKLQTSVGDTVKAIETLDPERATKYCVKFPMGHLSMYQMADFIGSHVLRHHHQLRRATTG